MAHLEEVVAPDYLTGVEDWSIDRVRFRRDQVTEVEIGLSYLRRIVQGRLDIVLAALHQRAAATPPSTWTTSSSGSRRSSVTASTRPGRSAAGRP